MVPPPRLVSNAFLYTTNILELGCGTGFASIILSSLCDKIIASDRDHSVLDLTKENFELNSHLTNAKCKVEFLNLDWRNFSSSQLKDVRGVDIIVACDVAYDCHISELYFSCLTQICSSLKKSMVKRFNRFFPKIIVFN